MSKIGLIEIVPKLEIDEIYQLVKNLSPDKLGKLDKSSTELDLDNLDLEIQGLIYQTFVHKSNAHFAALSSRFYRYLIKNNYAETYQIDWIDQNIENMYLPYILTDKKTQTSIWILVSSYFDHSKFEQMTQWLLKNKKPIKQNSDLFPNLKKSKNLTDSPDEIWFVIGKLERDVAIDNASLVLDTKSIHLEYFLEIFDKERPFSDEDYVLCANEKIRGVNFDSLSEVLTYLKLHHGKGQYEVKIESNNEITKIWEGLIFPAALLESKLI